MIQKVFHLSIDPTQLSFVFKSYFCLNSLSTHPILKDFPLSMASHSHISDTWTIQCIHLLSRFVSRALVSTFLNERDFTSLSYQTRGLLQSEISFWTYFAQFYLDWGLGFYLIVD